MVQVTRQEMTPLLLDVLEDCVNRAAELADDVEYTSHFYALMLLAQFRERRADPLAVRFALLPGEGLDALCGDFVTEISAGFSRQCAAAI